MCKGGRSWKEGKRDVNHDHADKIKYEYKTNALNYDSLLEKSDKPVRWSESTNSVCQTDIATYLTDVLHT